MNKNNIIIDTRASNNSEVIEKTFHLEDMSYPIYFKNKDSLLSENNEAYIICSLLPYMKTGTNMILQDTASHRLLTSIPTIMDIFHTWQPDLKKIEIHNAKFSNIKHSSKGRVGVFFSGGVDSFYTLLKHREEIDDLIFIYGFEMHIGETETYKKASQGVHKVADSLQKNVIEVETNLRTILDPYISWKIAHGSALATTGHLLSQVFSKIYIPSSDTYENLSPNGTHPVLDPLWSSESLEFVHDGCEANRVEKVRFISQFDVAMHNLRVCWEHYNDDYNCCECEKCVRTMLNLLAVDSLNRCTTFNRPLAKKNILAVQAHNPDIRPFYYEILKSLGTEGSYPEFYNSVDKILHRSQWPMNLKNKVINKIINYPVLLKSIKRLKNIIKV